MIQSHLSVQLIIQSHFFLSSGQRPPRTEIETSLDRDSLTETPWDRDSSEGTWDQAAKQELTSYKDPRRGQNDRHTLLKILPCPKLRLRAVINRL